MASNTECTVWHEAGHVAALRHFGVPVFSVEVTSESSGHTVYDQDAFDALDDKDAVLVVLVGMMAESKANDENSIDASIAILLGAESDRGVIYRGFRVHWEHLGDLGRQVAYRAVDKLIEKSDGAIREVAEALLAKKGFPKTLDATEIRNILGDSAAS